MDRRDFLKTTLAGAGLVAGLAPSPLITSVAEAAPKKKAVLKLCAQEWIIPGRNLKEKIEKILNWGGCGLEFGGMDVRRADQIRRELEGTGVRPAALCWGSHGGDLVATDFRKRKKGMDDLKKVLEAAGVLGSTGVIWVPCFNGESKLSPAELDSIMMEILPEIGQHAQQVNNRLLIEPLNKGETFYINRLEQALAFCQKTDSPGVCLMGDFYHMSKEEKDQERAFVEAGKWLHHVHLATGRSRILPGQEPHSYVEGFRGLQRLGYQDYCSLECGLKPTKPTRNDKGQVKLSADPEVEIPKAFAFLKTQWEQAGKVASSH